MKSTIGNKQPGGASSRVLLLSIALSLGLSLMLSSCGGGGGGGGGGDSTPPITAAFPAGGTYGSALSASLTANETATIYYSTDGTNPSVGGANTTTGPSPLAGILLSGGTTTLKYFAVDKAGNIEAVQTQTYVIDLTVPNVTVPSGAPSSLGLLASQGITWQSDKGGSYVVELGGTGIPGTGTTLATGSIAPAVLVKQTIFGTQLAYAGPTPLWIYVTDSLGHTGSTSVTLALKPIVPINVGGELRQIAMLPNGLKAYAARTDANSVAVIDTDPGSVDFNTVLTTVPVGGRPTGIAVTPDGSRVYVTNEGGNSISVIATSTDTVAATLLSGAISAPNGIAVTPDGTRAYFLSFAESISVLDVNPASPTFHTVTANIPRTLLLGGSIGITPDGSRAVVNWRGMIAHAVDVLDVNPTSPAFNTIISSPVPVVSGRSGGVALTSDSGFAYATDMNNLLCRVDLQTSATVSTSLTGPDSLALTPDGTSLLMGFLSGSTLRVVNASDLTVTADVSIGGVGAGAGILGGIAITPDGTYAYVNRDAISVNSQVIMVPLQ